MEYDVGPEVIRSPRWEVLSEMHDVKGPPQRWHTRQPPPSDGTADGWLGGLDDEERMLVEQRLWAHATYKELAADLGLRHRTQAMRKYQQALKRLAELVGASIPEECYRNVTKPESRE